MPQASGLRRGYFGFSFGFLLSAPLRSQVLIWTVFVSLRCWKGVEGTGFPVAKLHTIWVGVSAPGWLQELQQNENIDSHTVQMWFHGAFNKLWLKVSKHMLIQWLIPPCNSMIWDKLVRCPWTSSDSLHFMSTLRARTSGIINSELSHTCAKQSRRRRCSLICGGEGILEISQECAWVQLPWHKEPEFALYAFSVKHAQTRSKVSFLYA